MNRHRAKITSDTYYRDISDLDEESVRSSQMNLPSVSKYEKYVWVYQLN